MHGGLVVERSSTHPRDGGSILAWSWLFFLFFKKKISRLPFFNLRCFVFWPQPSLNPLTSVLPWQWQLFSSASKVAQLCLFGPPPPLTPCHPLRPLVQMSTLPSVFGVKTKSEGTLGAYTGPCISSVENLL
jgi:hypothetical protein